MVNAETLGMITINQVTSEPDDTQMKRRDFLTKGALGITAAGLAGCAASDSGPNDSSVVTSDPIRWKMVTSWPSNFPALGTGAVHVAELITRMSGGRLSVEVYAGGELVPPFEVFDAVSRGTAQMGHSASYYWKGRHEAVQFFAAIPFGLNAQQMNSWLYHGGGLELWTELYADFDLIPFPVGNSGVQMGGWFNREINSITDLAGLKMRIPGLGGEVLKRAGGIPVNLPGAEIFTSLKTGVIDATEWIGPYNDLAFGLYQAARYYYYPGWHEPGTTLECLIHRPAFEALPDDLQTIVQTACQAANLDMLSEFGARNARALQQLVDEHGVELRPFPDDVLRRLRDLSDEVVTEIAAGSGPLGQRVFDSYRQFRDESSAWQQISEVAYSQAIR